MHPKTLALWRRSVPDDFQFSVKCYRALTHEIGLRPVEDAFRVINLMVEYCMILRGKILVMQMPPGLKLDSGFSQDAQTFLKSASLHNIHLTLEFRAPSIGLPDTVVSLMRDFHIADTVDLSFEELRFEGICYIAGFLAGPKVTMN